MEGNVISYFLMTKEWHPWGMKTNIIIIEMIPQCLLKMHENIMRMKKKFKIVLVEVNTTLLKFDHAKMSQGLMCEYI